MLLATFQKNKFKSGIYFLVFLALITFLFLVEAFIFLSLLFILLGLVFQILPSLEDKPGKLILAYFVLLLASGPLLVLGDSAPKLFGDFATIENDDYDDSPSLVLQITASSFFIFLFLVVPSSIVFNNSRLKKFIKKRIRARKHQNLYAQSPGHYLSHEQLVNEPREKLKIKLWLTIFLLHSSAVGITYLLYQIYSDSLGAIGALVCLYISPLLATTYVEYHHPQMRFWPLAFLHILTYIALAIIDTSWKNDNDADFPFFVTGLIFSFILFFLSVRIGLGIANSLKKRELLKNLVPLTESSNPMQKPNSLPKP